jgi:hypothetical protein
MKQSTKSCIITITRAVGHPVPATLTRDRSPGRDNATWYRRRTPLTEWP